MKNHFMILALAVVLSVPALGWSHGGGLDKNGGHYNRKTGEYHLHRATYQEPAPARKSPPSEKITKTEKSKKSK